MESCEVLIVGGGPAGSTCAGKLREAGVDVLLLDKENFPRSKPCAGWITPAVLKTLEIDAEEYRRERLLQDIRGFRTGLINGPEVVTRYGKVVSYGIRRCEFDHYLLKRSAVRQALNEPVAALEQVLDKMDEEIAVEPEEKLDMSIDEEDEADADVDEEDEADIDTGDSLDNDAE